VPPNEKRESGKGRREAQLASQRGRKACPSVTAHVKVPGTSHCS